MKQGSGSRTFPAFPFFANPHISHLNFLEKILTINISYTYEFVNGRSLH